MGVAIGAEGRPGEGTTSGRTYSTSQRDSAGPVMPEPKPSSWGRYSG